MNTISKIVLWVIGILCILAPFVTWIYSIVLTVQFNSNCSGYLELAGRANSVENAETNLTKAINYLEENDITSGANVIFVYRPENDIGIWYNNLKTAQIELQQMIADGNSTNLEKSNMLMKLRETLLNEDGGVIKPFDVEYGDMFTVLFWCNCTLWLLWIAGAACCYVAYDN